MKIFHVAYGCGCPLGLNYIGARQMEEATAFLKKQKVNPSRSRALVSLESRAIGSAEIICGGLNLPQAEKVGWLADRADVRQRISEFARKNPRLSVLIVVSTEAVVRRALDSFAREFDPEFEVLVGRGSVYLVNTAARTITESIPSSTD